MQVSEANSVGLDKNVTVGIVVDDAKKEVHLLESFITYRINTTIEKPGSPKEVFEVRRRFTDFEWLHTKLQESNPGCVIPPLPDKNSLKNIDKFEDKFIALRLIACQKFLCRVVAHSLLKSTVPFRVFLTAKAWELESYKKANPTVNLLDKMTSQIKELGGRAASVQVGKGGISFRAPGRAADRFGEVRELAEVSKERLHKLISQLNDIASDERAISAAESELASMFTQFANNEDVMRAAILACSTALTSSTQLVNDRVDHLLNNTIPALHEYESFGECVKRALRNVDVPEAEYYRLTAQLERGGLSSQKHAQIEEEARRLKQQFESIGDDLHVDFSRWRDERDDDLRNAFLNLAETQVRKYEASIRAWEEAVQPIQNTLESSSTGDYSD